MAETEPSAPTAPHGLRLIEPMIRWPVLAAEACDDRKAIDIQLIRVEEISSLADWFVICTGLSDVQVRAIGRSVEDRLELEAGRLPLRGGPGGGSLGADRLRRADRPHPHTGRSGSTTTWNPSGAMGNTSLS
jgi:hypothetical protein